MNYIGIFLILSFVFIFYLVYLLNVVFNKKFGFKNFIITNIYILLYAMIVIIYYLTYREFTGNFLEAIQLIFSVLISKGIYIDFIRQIDRQSTKYLRFIVVNIIAYSLIFTQFIILFSKIPNDYLNILLSNELIYSASYIFKLYIILLFVFEFTYLFKNLSYRYHRDILNNLLIASFFLLLVIVEVLTVKKAVIIPVRVTNYTILGVYILYSRNIFDDISIRGDIIKNKIGKVSFKKHESIGALNDVMNREYFMKIINTFDCNEKTSVLIIEILGLKYINDILGYEYGDEMIQEFIVLISDIFNCSAIARLSGMKFAIVLDNITEEDIRVNMKNIRKLFMEREEFRVFVVYGYYMCNSNYTLEEMFRFASENLFNMRYSEIIDNQETLVNMLHSNFKKQYHNIGEYMEEVSGITVDFCEYLGVDKDISEKIKCAALLDDITIEEHFEYKDLVPVFNDDFESKKYYNHTIRSYEICVETGVDVEVCKMVLHSHENYDGSGFPSGLKGDEISFGAQILSIVNFVTLFYEDTNIIEALEDNRNIRFSDYIVENMIDFLNAKE